jgi:ABC-type branched-subunit amino acid transport system substrate-binding protein
MASRTNPLNYDYGEAFDGTRAYFAMINSQGGVFGRKLNLAEANDVGFDADQSQVTKLLSQQSIFAVAPVAALLFPGASLLAAQCVPTFGWNINAEWADGPSLFGDKGSNINFTSPAEGTAWLAQTLGKKRVGVLGYGITSSAQCVQGQANTWKRYPEVAQEVYSDAALPYPLTDVSADVSKMKQAGVDFVATCVDTNGMVTIAREMQKQDFHPVLTLPDGYYNQIKNDPIFNGAYVTTFFAPLETQDPPAGLAQYEDWMHRTGGRMSELSIAGWTSADMLVTGIKAAGPNFDRSSVVAALNKMTNYTANGVLPGINWTIAHTSKWSPSCSAESQVENGAFVPRFGQPGKPFVCWPIFPPPGPVQNPTIK